MTKEKEIGFFSQDNLPEYIKLAKVKDRREKDE